MNDKEFEVARMNEREQEYRKNDRINRIAHAAAAMLKPDSPAQFIDAAINVAFRIDTEVTRRVDKGE